MHPNSVSLSLLDEMYEKYQQDCSCINPSWREYFLSLEKPIPKKIATGEYPSDLRIYNLINAYRNYGHLMANINPIATKPIEEPWQLRLQTLGFNPDELNHEFPTCGLLDQQMASLQRIIETLRNIYCENIGVEYMGLQSPDLENWLQQHIEPSKFKISLSIDQKKMILKQLNRSELFESFIQTKYTGQKRFSLEGGETLIPMLEAVIETGNKLGMEEFVIGMAHRGRLNVLSNILNKSHSDIFSEFEEGYIPLSFEGSGDVKYHKGFFAEVTTISGKKVKVTLSPNPSHLESVDPVVEGIVKARQINQNDEKQEKIIPILVHGDAAVAGQGIIYETLQLYNLPGYSTGGTIHIIINNQIGFTATPEESRSTRYCSDLARAFSAPIFHVNAEDPEGCVYATNLAVELRQKFHCDVFIDLNCYRKYGHNEADEPSFTQPLEYKIIRKKRPIREIYRDQLIQQSVLEKHIAEELEAEFTRALQQALKETKLSTKLPKEVKPAPAEFHAISTHVPKETIKKVAQKLCSVPDNFHIHPKLKNLLQERLEMADGKRSLDWGMAEMLAYSTLLWEGYSVRISGQDCRRGTFSHRHAVWRDQESGQEYCSLEHLKTNQGRFQIYNSPLSENAVLGFEFGYSTANPESLVIWEAQFGDFCNGAQVIIDQFIASAEQKWSQKFSVVLFLPHGYEGQGPEHSSARMERFLSLAGDDNMRIIYPTTPAQFFHLLREQVLDKTKKPLIVFTPKGLLRYPGCVNVLQDFTKGKFEEILVEKAPKDVKKVILCTGRVYYDLIFAREKSKEKGATIIRIEELYPFPEKAFLQLVKHYKNVKQWFWVQEEPENMGAWSYIRPYLMNHIPQKASLEYVGRQKSASTAAGSFALHKKQHANIIDALFPQSKQNNRK